MESMWETASRLRQEPQAKYDQLFATYKTVLSRVTALMNHTNIYGRRILLVGDDDLLSMALMDALNEEFVAPEICVVDIDTALLGLIRTVGHEEVETVKYDVRNPLPKNLRSRFDLVFTDPPYTVDGQGMFLGRAREALKKKPSSICYLCYSPADLRPRRILEVQKIVNEMGFVIDALCPSFNTYEAAKRRESEKLILHFQSDLLRLKFVPGAGRKRVSVGRRIYKYD